MWLSEKTGPLVYQSMRGDIKCNQLGQVKFIIDAFLQMAAFAACSVEFGRSVEFVWK